MDIQLLEAQERVTSQWNNKQSIVHRYGATLPLECPLYPRKQTLINLVSVSAKAQKRILRTDWY